MKSHHLALVAAGLLVLGVTVNAQPVVIFDNGTPDLQSGVISDFDEEQQAADNFVLQTGMATITDVHWWGVYDNTTTLPSTDNFTIQFYNDLGGVPDSAPFTEFNVGNVGRESTGEFLTGPGFAFEAFAYSAVIPTLPLSPNTRYWISIINDTANDPARWGWLTSDFIFGNGAYRATSSASWTPAVEDFAFNLTAVPLPPGLNVKIDIKPGSNTNPINPTSKGNVPVAILTTEDFDASMVDVSTVQFGPGTAPPVKYAIEDVDGDGDWDLALKFKTRDTAIACGDSEASLTGSTFDDVLIAGTDTIKTVGCNKQGRH